MCAQQGGHHQHAEREALPGPRQGAGALHRHLRPATLAPGGPPYSPLDPTCRGDLKDLGITNTYVSGISTIALKAMPYKHQRDQRVQKRLNFDNLCPGRMHGLHFGSIIRRQGVRNVMYIIRAADMYKHAIKEDSIRVANQGMQTLVSAIRIDSSGVWCR